MGRNYDPEDLDPEEAAWAAQKAKAAARQATAQSMAGMPAVSVKDYDEQRRQQMLRDQELTRAAAITPGSLVGDDDPFNIDMKVSLPGSVVDPVVPAPAPTTSTAVAAPANNPQTSSADAVFWTCRVGEDKDAMAIYAHTWEDLKARLVKYPGLWTATEHRFPNTPNNILGFFVPNQYVFPANTASKQFEVIVKDGKVFKAES